MMTVIMNTARRCTRLIGHVLRRYSFLTEGKFPGKKTLDEDLELYSSVGP